MLNLIGLWMSFLGGFLLFLDSLRISDRLPDHGLILVPNKTYKHPVWKFVAPLGFALVTVGFALQLPAACSAHHEQQPTSIYESVEHGP